MSSARGKQLRGGACETWTVWMRAELLLVQRLRLAEPYPTAVQPLAIGTAPVTGIAPSSVVRAGARVTVRIASISASLA